MKDAHVFRMAATVGYYLLGIAIAATIAIGLSVPCIRAIAGDDDWHGSSCCDRVPIIMAFSGEERIDVFGEIKRDPQEVAVAREVADYRKVPVGDVLRRFEDMPRHDAREWPAPDPLGYVSLTHCAIDRYFFIYPP